MNTTGHITPSVPRSRLRSAALRLSLAVLAGMALCTAGHAGPLRASASLTGFPAVTAEAESGQAYAAYPDAQNPMAEGTARRRHLIIDVQGGGPNDPYSAQYGAATDVSTAYELWNLRENRPLTFEEAAPLVLNFNFNLSGITSTDGAAHLRSVGVSGLLTGGNWARGFGDNASYVAGPPQDVATGNQSLLASVVDLDWSLQHTAAAGGTVGMALQGAAAITGALTLDLWLESVTLVEQQVLAQALMHGAGDAFEAHADAPLGWSLQDGLGVLLRDGPGASSLIVVVAAANPGALPAPPTLALLLPLLWWLAPWQKASHGGRRVP